MWMEGVLQQVYGCGEWGYYAFLALVGATYGILCCLDNDVFVASKYVSDQRFVGITGQWVDSARQEGLMCVYAPTDRSQREVFLFKSLTRAAVVV